MERVGFVCKLTEFSIMPTLFKREVPSWSEAISWLPFLFPEKYPQTFSKGISAAYVLLLLVCQKNKKGSSRSL